MAAPTDLGTAPPLSAFAPRLGLTWPDPDDRVVVVDGTLGFFDVSGYTRLTERLATLGAEGGEAITEIADTLFQGLIGAARNFGGDVIQFSGDALLIHFTGTGHAVRAAAAADRMQAFVRANGGLSTEVGRVRLRMSVGIHSGPATFVLLGRTQHMVLAVGPHVSTTCAMEKEADAGQVLVSHDTAALLPSGWVTPHGSGALLRLGRPVADEQSVGPPPDVDPGWERSFVAPALRDLLLDGALPGEYRQLSLAFIAIRRLDALLDRHGAAGLARVLLGLTDAVERLTAEHGLLWVKVDALPDAFDLVIAAGTPAMHEDDEDRLLTVCRALLDADLGLELAIGVNRGRNFTGTVGHRLRREYSISGDATNLAARIMANATIGELAVHRPVLERVHVPVDVTPRPPFMAKGKRLPVDTVRVDTVDLGSTVSLAATLPMVGRTPELAMLRAATAEALAGEGRVLDVAGPAGIGKSRLLHAAVDEAGSAVPIATGEPYRHRTAFHAVRPTLRALVGIEPDTGPHGTLAVLRTAVATAGGDSLAWLPLVAPAFGAEATTSAAADRIHPDFVAEATNARLTELVSVLAPAGTIFGFDGLQWFDEQSRDLADSIARIAPTRGWVVVGTRRTPTDDCAPLPEAATIALGPLDDDESSALMLAASGDVALSDRVFAMIGRRAGGNPFFLRELVELAARRGDDLPESVERVVAGHIDALTPRDRLTLRTAAVLGTSAELELLGELVEADPQGRPLGLRLEPLHQFLAVTGREVRFHSETVQQVAYEGLSHRARTALHRRAADRLEATAGVDTDRIARHRAAGRDWPGAWASARRAATEATEQGAVGAAFELWELAVRAAARVPGLPEAEVAAAWESLGDVANRIGELDRAHAAYREARTLVPDGNDAARLARKRGDVAEKEGRYSQSLRWYSRGLRELETAPTGHDRDLVATELELSYAATLHQQDRNREGMRRARDALERARRLDAPDLVAQAFLQIATTAAFLNDVDHGPVVAEAEAAIRARSDDLRLACLMLNVGLAECEANEFGPGLLRYAEAAAAFARCGDVIGEVLTVHNAAEVRCTLGDLDTAEPAFVSARRRFRASGYRVGELLAESGIGRVTAFRSDPGRALTLLTSVATGFTELGHGSFAVDTELRIAECHLIAGDHDRARTALAATGTRIRALDRSDYLTVWLDRLTATAIRTDDPDAARETLLRSLGRARSAGLLVEVTTHLDALLRLPSRPGDPTVTWSDERDELVARLGVVRLLTL